VILLFIFLPQEWLSMANILALIYILRFLSLIGKAYS
jgi:hypothetical protein